MSEHLKQAVPGVLQAYQSFPDVEPRNQCKAVSLGRAAGGDALAITIFPEAAWSPNCIIELQALGAHRAVLDALGATLVLVSPQTIR